MARTEAKWIERAGGYLETDSPLGLDILINGESKYLNFNELVGEDGYGFRDNAGVMEFKSEGGAWTAIGAGGVTDHGGLTGLTDDDHLQYALLAGRAGGQTLIGGTASGNNLTLQSTSHATKGSIILGTTTYYDQVNNRLGINNSTPYASLVVTGTSATTARMGFAYSNTYGQTYWTADFSSGSQNSNILTGYINQIGGTGTQWIQVLGNQTVTFSNNVTTSGVFYAGTGSATFPSLSFGSDSNTGIYRPSIDTVAFATGGIFRGSINSAGTLTMGAGTVSAIPQNTSSTFVPAIGAFTTSGSAGISAGVTDGTNNRRAGLFVNQTDAIWGLSHSYSSGRIPFVIISNVTEQLRIDTSHNMGLGVTNVKARIHSAVDVAGGTHNASLIINNVNAGTGGLGTGPYTGIDFSHLNNQASDIQRKASIGFEKITTFSRGDLVFSICGTADNTNVSYLTDEKMRLTMAGNLGIGLRTVTAYLHIKAGTATANTAPLKFTSGTNLTTAENGAMEYDGTNLFFTRTGAVRENVLMSSAVTTELVVSDTTVTVNIGGTNYKLLARA